ncbi:MAG: hypothetical protein ACP5D8_03645, partial [Fidelibacterota bacterium]
LNAAQQRLNTERSAVLEPHEMGFERRQALEYRIAAIEPMNTEHFEHLIIEKISTSNDFTSQRL